MLREVAHFLRHVPDVARLSRRLSQAELFDLLSRRADDAGLRAWRARLADGLAGRVLEVGCGTGLMLPHYPAGLAVVGIEPEPSFLARARALARPPVTLAAADAQQLPFADASFDAVVFAGVLCSIPAVDRALSEVHRVLRPGGEVRLIEHVRSPRFVPGLLMHVCNPLWRLYNRQGCNMNRRTGAALLRGGFAIVQEERFQVFSPGLPAFPSVYLRARPVTGLGHTGGPPP